MNTKLKMAIVGAGIWGENHARIYRAHPFCEVVAVCDRDRLKAEALAAKMGIDRYYDDYREMFKTSGCDAVAIVTPDFATRRRPSPPRSIKSISWWKNPWPPPGKKCPPCGRLLKKTRSGSW